MWVANYLLNTYVPGFQMSNRPHGSGVFKGIFRLGLLGLGIWDYVSTSYYSVDSRMPFPRCPDKLSLAFGRSRSNLRDLCASVSKWVNSKGGIDPIQGVGL